MPRLMRMTMMAVESASTAYWDTSISPMTMATNKHAAMMPRIDVFIVKFRMFFIARKYGEVMEKNTQRMIRAMRMLMISPEKFIFRPNSAMPPAPCFCAAISLESFMLSFPAWKAVTRGGAPAPQFLG